MFFGQIRKFEQNILCTPKKLPAPTLMILSLMYLCASAGVAQWAFAPPLQIGTENKNL